MPYVGQIRILRAFYISVALTLACLAIATQIFIQVVLYQEHLGGVAEGQIAQSSILSQQIQQDMLIQLIPNHKPLALSRLKIEVPIWEKTQSGIYNNGISPDVDMIFAPVRSDYQTMETSVSSLMQQEEAKKPDAKVVSKAITGYFYANNDFLPAAEKALSSVYTSDEIQAEKVHWIELFFCGLTLLTIIVEMVFVARPALKKLNENIHELQNILHNRQEFQANFPTIETKERR